jgi:hypothetical protein
MIACIAESVWSQDYSRGHSLCQSKAKDPNLCNFRHDQFWPTVRYLTYRTGAIIQLAV